VHIHKEVAFIFIEWVISMTPFKRNIGFHFLCLRCLSFTSGPVLEANAFDYQAKRGGRHFAFTLTERDAPYLCRILKLPITSRRLS
jgi:hypothetical protein